MGGVTRHNPSGPFQPGSAGQQKDGLAIPSIWDHNLGESCPRPPGIISIGP